jgi:hypothetical protein
MSNLVLDSLEIKNFRAFKHLRIEKLGRVNLIVGKNNVGKSSVLEALWLYGKKGDLSIIWSILGARDESGLSLPSLLPAVEDRVASMKYLFHDRKPITEYDYPPFVYIGPISEIQDDTFFIGIADPIAPSTIGRSRVAPVIDFEELELFTDADFSLVAGYDRQVVYTYSLTSRDPQTVTYKSERPSLNCIHMSAQGGVGNQIVNLWDAIALTDLEENVLMSLRIIDFGVERINLVGNSEPSANRHPIVKLRGLNNPIPLRSMGEGMNRMFGIALALVNAKDGILLIDEVDTGLHYSVLPDLWKLIFEVAHRLNVQVFATSHSWDCVEAFQQAAEDNTEEGMLIRLESQEGTVVPVMFDERKLNIATREHIEVR